MASTTCRIADRAIEFTSCAVVEQHGTITKYSDEPSRRTSHKLPFLSERLRSMLRGIDTVLTG